MPKLYYTQSSCSFSCFIAAWTIGLSLECEQVNIQTHKTASGADYYKINPKGNVPALVFEDGMLLNENAVVLQWIADQVSFIDYPHRIAPAHGSHDLYLVQNCLNWIASELHASFGPLFGKNSEEMKKYHHQRCNSKLIILERDFLNNGNYLVCDYPTIADYYLYVVLNWSSFLGIDLTDFPKSRAFLERMGELPNVKEAHARMEENPSIVCVGSSMTEKVTAAAAAISENMKPMVEKISEKVQPVVDKVNETVKPVVQKVNDQLVQASENIKQKWNELQTEKIEPAMEKASEQFNSSMETTKQKFSDLKDTTQEKVKEGVEWVGKTAKGEESSSSSANVQNDQENQKPVNTM